MGFVRLFLLLVIAHWSNADDPVEVREYVWTNYKDFIDFGWREWVPGVTKTYSAPSEVNTKLYELNKNFTDEVWGWTGHEFVERNYYSLNPGAPEYCGMINATISFKFYLEGLGNQVETHYYPACTSVSQNPHVCRYGNSEFPKWSLITFKPVLPISSTRYKVIAISAFLSATGLYLIDEVRMTYAVQQGVKCPFSCLHDCEYRSIDCHNYYTCIDRKYKEFYSCSKEDGLAFNPNTKSCDFIENVPGCNVTKPPPPPHCICEYRPHYDCSQYYYCPDTCHPEECEVRQCPPGLLWTTDSKGDGSGHQQCVLPDKATCFNETISTTPEWWQSSSSTDSTTNSSAPATESTSPPVDSTPPTTESTQLLTESSITTTELSTLATDASQPTMGSTSSATDSSPSTTH